MTNYKYQYILRSNRYFIRCVNVYKETERLFNKRINNNYYILIKIFNNNRRDYKPHLLSAGSSMRISTNSSEPLHLIPSGWPSVITRPTQKQCGSKV